MAKIRTVKPELFRHEMLFESEQQCGLPLRLAFIGLFSCCDREGRFRWEPRSLKLDILPYDDIDFADVLNTLWTAGFIKKYIWQNKYYGFIPSWHQHQSINTHEPASKLPDPEKCTHESTEVLSTALQMQAYAKQTPISAMHTPISDMHMHARALHEPVSISSNLEKCAQKSHAVMQSTPLHMHAHALHGAVSATHKSVSACSTTVTNQMTINENNMTAIQPTNAFEPVPEPVHATIEPEHSHEIADMHMPLSDMHMHARALHGGIRATHDDASAAHVHASLEVEVEVEMEGELEVDMEQEVERNVEMEKNWGANRNIVAPARRRSITTAQISEIFNHWKITLQHPQAVLDKKRHRLIQQALQQGYTVAQLCDAISGCAQTPHNLGENDRGQRYDGLHIILRDADQIERFMRNHHSPPRPSNPADKLLQTNLAAGKNWLQRKQQQTETDPDEKS